VLYGNIITTRPCTRRTPGTHDQTRPDPDTRSRGVSNGNTPGKHATRYGTTRTTRSHDQTRNTQTWNVHEAKYNNTPHNTARKSWNFRDKPG